MEHKWLVVHIFWQRKCIAILIPFQSIDVHYSIGFCKIWVGNWVKKKSRGNVNSGFLSVEIHWWTGWTVSIRGFDNSYICILVFSTGECNLNLFQVPLLSMRHTQNRIKILVANLSNALNHVIIVSDEFNSLVIILWTKSIVTTVTSGHLGGVKFTHVGT